MPWPGFSELSFGFSFLREFERLYTLGGSFPSAPDFISQNDEALKGYDVEVALKNSVPVFFQFKRSFVLTTHNALPIQHGDFQHPNLYKMYLYKKSNFEQHHALQKLEKDGNCVLYVTSQISNFPELTAAYSAKKVVEESTALFSPLEIKLPNLQQDHYLCFRANDNFAYLYSENGRKFKRRYPSWKEARSSFDGHQRTTSENRSRLSEIAGQLAHGNAEAAQIAARFSHPAIKVSVLAFLTLDAQLTFYHKG